MKNLSHLLLVFASAAAITSQSYPRLEIRGNVLVNNSFIIRPRIGEGHSDSLHCVTDNSDCCSNGEGNWYDETGGEVQQQGSVGDSDRLYVTRGDGVVYLSRKTGGISGLYECRVSHNRYEYFEGTSITGPSATQRVQSEFTWQTMSFTQFHISPSETYKRQRYLQDTHQ